MCYIPPEIMLCVYFQINTLKENLCKAEAEVCELDKLVDQVREVYKEPWGYRYILGDYWSKLHVANSYLQVLHCNISHVKECRPLLLLLKELDGNEAPNHYW